MRKKLDRPLETALGYTAITEANKKMSDVVGECLRCGLSCSETLEEFIEFKLTHVCDPRALNEAKYGSKLQT
jgi:hypothetical protein